MGYNPNSDNDFVPIIDPATNMIPSSTNFA